MNQNQEINLYITNELIQNTKLKRENELYDTLKLDGKNESQVSNKIKKPEC